MYMVIFVHFYFALFLYRVFKLCVDLKFSQPPLITRLYLPFIGFSGNFSSFNPTTYIGTVKISKMKIVSFCIFWFKLVSGLQQTSVYSAAQVCIMYDEVSRNANNGETNANKLITRPIMTVISPLDT